MSRNATLLALAIEGNLSDSECSELLHALKKDPVLRAEFGKQAVLNGLLGPVLENDFSHEQLIAKYMTAVRETDQELFLRKVSNRVLWMRCKRGMAWAAVATLLVGLFLWHVIPQPLAIVTSIDAVSEETSFAKGKQFFKGDRLRLERGLVELDLAGRGRMLVEGPAELQWHTSMTSKLTAGRVLLSVNKRGRGYQLATPQGNIVDLGTQFGVFIDSFTNKVETHVLDGEVQAFPDTGSEPILLRKNEALRFSNSSSVKIPADQGAFYRTAPPRHRGSMNLFHWSMEPGDSGRTQSNYQAVGGDVLTMKMHGDPQLVPGPFGMARSFNGNGQYAESNYRGVGGNHPRTVAFWVKVPADFNTNQGFAVISWGKLDSNKPGSVWQISINPLAQNGPIGRLRLGVHGGMVIGSTDLRDDRWHHVAVVLYPAENPKIGQQVLLYLNGNMEPISSRVLGEIDTNVDDVTHGVWLARNISGFAPHGEFFRGAIDEVYIFDAALSQHQIRDLLERNEPPQGIRTAPDLLVTGR